MRAFEGLDFGINDINPTSAAAPFGGMKDSGMGREGPRKALPNISKPRRPASSSDLHVLGRRVWNV
ncbi:aldehyde dehydrogenase family protein [Salinisphaera sp. T5B8]|uniref:aldehyde dehydrogenase family protein n=1 Tax=Salinisphaera sp. T5B8 TaxID=1304154 RepID=UPI00333F4F55